MADTINSGNRQNEPTGKSVHTRSRFDLSYHFYDTFRFGEYHPHFVMESVRGDKNVQVRSAHDVRSYSLKAPLMSSIQYKKDYFAVPMQAILPLNWDKIYTNPNIGDDVPADAGTYISDFTLKIRTFLNLFITDNYLSAQNIGSVIAKDQYITNMFRLLLTAELFYSNGSLLSSLGIHLASACKFTMTPAGSNTVYTGVDAILDAFPSMIRLICPSVNSNTIVSIDIQDGDDPKRIPLGHMHQIIELLRDNLGTFSIYVCPDVDGSVAFTTPTLSLTAPSFEDFQDFGLDIKRVLAYQICCAHYYSNDSVDYIFSAELYRQYIGNLYDKILNDSSFTLPQFVYNGMNLPYDFLSARVISDSISSINFLIYRLSIIQAVFSYRHSLRYVDYFVGSRTRPLAVGDASVAVQNGKVSIINMAERTQATKFYNAVNRIGRKFSNYLEGLFPDAADVPQDYHNPFWLAHTTDTVYGQEVENANVYDQLQNDEGLQIISNLKSNGSKYAFEFDSTMPCIIIGISYFDVPRSYWKTIERQNFHANRFDMFNPYMQFIGDQEVYSKELNPERNGYGAFGYQLRHAEYKQRYNQAAGGFVNNLPGFTFLNDYDNVESGPLSAYHVSPSFIRSKSYELDRFYIALTGYSLASYFHFIVDNYNMVKASRPMAAAPTIL